MRGGIFLPVNISIGVKMKTFTDWLIEQSIDERALNIGNKSAMPAFNQAVILAGGAGSGKGMVLNNILNIPNAKVFDVDKLKTDILTLRPKSMAAAFEKQTGRKLETVDLGKPEDVALMHKFVSDNKYDKKVIDQFFISTGDFWPDGTPKKEPNKNKPNVVFDVTLKDEKKMFDLCVKLQHYGWDKKDIHLVWILNDFEVASIQNQSRARKVPEKIFAQTHVGASNTMKEIVTNFKKFAKCMDGEIWIVPNQRNVDNVFEFSGKNQKGDPILKLKFYTAMKVKERGAAVPNADEVLSKHFTKEGKQGESLESLIAKYVPADADKWQ